MSYQVEFEPEALTDLDRKPQHPQTIPFKMFDRASSCACPCSVKCTPRSTSITNRNAAQKKSTMK
jgi:hypothetical protein